MAQRDPGRSRVTAVVRLLAALWLIGSAVATLASPERLGELAAARGASPEATLLGAGASFALGVFLLSGFMSRVAGLALALLSGWLLAQASGGAPELLLAAVGVYLVFRGGGTCAMDVYVQKMQERVRMKEALRSQGADAPTPTRDPPVVS